MTPYCIKNYLNIMNQWFILQADGSGSRWSTVQINMPQSLVCVVFTPTITMATSEARAMLPDTIARTDAVYNMSRLALLVHCIATVRGHSHHALTMPLSYRFRPSSPTASQNTRVGAIVKSVIMFQTHYNIAWFFTMF